MARGYGRRRGNGLSPRMILIIAGGALVVLVGALFWFAGQADGHKPPVTEIRVNATNVGVQANKPPGGENGPTQ